MVRWYICDSNGNVEYIEEKNRERARNCMKVVYEVEVLTAKSENNYKDSYYSSEFAYIRYADGDTVLWSMVG